MLSYMGTVGRLRRGGMAMRTRLNSEDLDLLTTVQNLGRGGMTEREIADRLRLGIEPLRERLSRIRLAFESLNRVAALATGEELPQPSRHWEVVIEEPRELVGCARE